MSLLLSVLEFKPSAVHLVSLTGHLDWKQRKISSLVQFKEIIYILNLHN